VSVLHDLFVVKKKKKKLCVKKKLKGILDNWKGLTMAKITH